MLAFSIIGIRRCGFGVFLLVFVLHHAPRAIDSVLYVSGVRKLQLHQLAKNFELCGM